ncbi:MAG: glycosyltransferase family 4 protein [Bacteroidales bacterium]|nr:glycosyltransferase family 4 protein [Bacteroidales bacterium]
MKILYLRTLFFFGNSGGLVGHTAGVINSMAKKTDLKVVSNSSLPEVEVPVEVIPPIKSKVLPIDIRELIYNRTIIKKLRKQINQFDAIYHRLTKCSYSAASLSKKYNVPLIIEYNSSEIWKIKHWGAKGNPVFSFFKKMVKYIFLLPMVSIIEKNNLHTAKWIVVVSDNLKEELVQRGFPESKIIVNPNGVSPEKFSPSISGDSVREKYNFGKEIVVGFIGTFSQWHGVIEMAKAIKKYYERNKNSNIRFLLIGDGNLSGQVKKLISESPGNENVVFTGLIPQNQAPQHLAACDILLSPHINNVDGSKFFGSPTKLFEYMAMGKAIIASNLEQVGEILDHDVDSILVEPGNVEELTNAIEVLVQEKDKLKILGNNALKKVVKKYTWDKHVEKILNKFTNK